jgi:hypothetical protein
MSKIAIVYWCQGAGHAARSIPVAKEFESRGHEVMIDGGGPGQKFVEMNGYEDKGYNFEDIPVISKSPLDIIVRGLTEVIPSALKRFRTVVKFLREEDPDNLETDCPVTIFAATLLNREFYAINHLRASYFNLLGRPGAELLERLTLFGGEDLFLTCLWSDEESREGVVKVEPLAQEGEGEVEEYDVLLSPGSFGEGFQNLRDRLADQGLEVRTVGDENWETEESMTPYTKAADCVVCTGFSSIADAVVPGTRCVAYPHLHMQELLTKQIDKRDFNGVRTAYSLDEAVEKVSSAISQDFEAPEFENGAAEVVDCVLE